MPRFIVEMPLNLKDFNSENRIIFINLLQPYGFCTFQISLGYQYKIIYLYLNKNKKGTLSYYNNMAFATIFSYSFVYFFGKHFLYRDVNAWYQDIAFAWTFIHVTAAWSINRVHCITLQIYQRLCEYIHSKSINIIIRSYYI